MGKFDVEGKLCVISGGSQGVGFEILKLLVLQKASVVIVARTEAVLKVKCEELRELILDKDQQSVNYKAADLSSYESCEKVFADLQPDIVMCCAGSAKPQLFTELSGSDLETGVKLNYSTALYFSHCAFNKMVRLGKADKKHIVFFSSVVAFYSFIGYAQYAPLKAAIRSLSDILRQEGLPYNIDVSCVFPGNFASEGFEIENETKPEITKIIEGPSDAISSEECAKLVLKQLSRGSRYVTTDFVGYLLNTMMLGDSPRNWWVVQFLLGCLMILIAPVLRLYVNLQILKYFKKND